MAFFNFDSYHPTQIKPSFDLGLSYARALAGIFEKKEGNAT
jgi:hypothetical protein